MATIKVYTIQNKEQYEGGRWFAPAEQLRDVKIALKIQQRKIGSVKGPFEMDENFLNQELTKIKEKVEETEVLFWDDTWAI